MSDRFLESLRVANAERCKRWHGEAGIMSWEGSMWACASGGEMGEALNVVKKIRRAEDNIQSKAVADTIPELVQKLGLEIGDTIVYLDLLAQRYGLRLENCIRDTFNRVSIREGFPETL